MLGIITTLYLLYIYFRESYRYHQINRYLPWGVRQSIIEQQEIDGYRIYLAREYNLNTKFWYVCGETNDDTLQQLKLYERMLEGRRFQTKTRKRPIPHSIPIIARYTDGDVADIYNMPDIQYEDELYIKDIYTGEEHAITDD